VSVPGWLTATLLSLAAWRTWALIGTDDITERPRRYVMTKVKGTEEFFECPFCLGFWVALAWWGAWQVWPHGTLVVAGAAAIAALVPLIERLSSDD
jgi:Protein of unknown function (DUF1360)